MSAAFEQCNHPGCTALVWVDRDWLQRDAEARAQKEELVGKHYRTYEIPHNGHAHRRTVLVGQDPVDWITEEDVARAPVAPRVQLRFGCYPLDVLLP